MATHFQTRLVGPRGINMDPEGVVEVLYQGTWGRICDDGFDNIVNDANCVVVCKTLAYGYGVPVHPSQAGRYTSLPGNNRVWLDNVECTGLEMNIGECLRGVSMNKVHCTYQQTAVCSCVVSGSTTSTINPLVTTAPSTYFPSSSCSTTFLLLLFPSFPYNLFPLLLLPLFHLLFFSSPFFSSFFCIAPLPPPPPLSYILPLISVLFAKLICAAIAGGVCSTHKLGLYDQTNMDIGVAMICLSPGQCSYICDDGWNQVDAQVFCSCLQYNEYLQLPSSLQFTSLHSCVVLAWYE